jgi:LysM repeat protein
MLSESSHSLASSKRQSNNNLASCQNGPLRHRVKPGETLFSIATSYKTTVAALKENNSNVATLRPGMVLIIRDGQ